MMMGFGQFDGTPTEEMITYYEERAKGGAGLIATEITRIDDKTGAAAFNQLGISQDYHVEPLRTFAERIHVHGAKFFVQLHHPGRQNVGLMVGTIPLCIAMDRLTKKFGKLLFKLAPSAGKFLLHHKIVPAAAAPSKEAGVSYFSEGRVRSLRHGEIKKLVESFALGAARAQKAGCDGVYLHAAHGYLIQQFLSPHTNRRTDEYGGSLENRMRFLLEIIDGIKKVCPSFPIVVRLSVDELYSRLGQTGRGYTITDGVEIAKRLESVGIDALDVSCASYDTFNYWLEPSTFSYGWRTDMIRAIRDAVSLPIIAVNVIRTPDEAERQLTEGLSDFVALGRPHIADPHWANKAQSGRASEIKRCISCLYCFESMQTNAYAGKHGECSVNLFLGNENQPLPRDGEGKTVAVLGAGPAGLSTAELLLLRGFNVVVFEKESRAGGQVALAASEALKARIGWCVTDLENAVARLGGEIRYSTAATLENLHALSPYSIIAATGGSPIVPKSIDGIDKPFVYPSTAVFTKEIDPKNKKIAVIGSGMTGLDTAVLLAEKGNAVTVVEMADTVAPGIWMQHRDDALPRLAEYGAKILTSHKLVRITDDGVLLENLKEKTTVPLPVDLVILAIGVRPNSALLGEIKNEFPRVYTVGDAVKSGRISNATHSAWEVVLKLKVEN
jgi:2,4-dienoyl-CoA reductase-like NADH-dependent reductase (Old Yellow Enzyme family)/thioredoxin reductase